MTSWLFVLVGMMISTMAIPFFALGVTLVSTFAVLDVAIGLWMICWGVIVGSAGVFLAREAWNDN